MSDGGAAGAARIFVRATLVLVAAGLVFGAAWRWLGAPSVLREYRQDELARFRPTAGHGVGQFFGEAGLLALYTWAARRWLRMRL